MCARHPRAHRRMSAPAPAPYAAARYMPPASIRWNGWWFLLAIGPHLVVATVSRLAPLHVPEAVGPAVSLAVPVLVYAWMTVVLFLASRLRGLRTLRDDFGWSIEPIDLLTGSAAAVLLFAVAFVVAPIVRSLGAPESNIHLTGDHAFDAVRVFLLPTVLAAPVEELLFRGLLMRWIRIALLRRRAESQTAAVHVSVVVSAGAFALAHLHEAFTLGGVVNLSLQTFALGIVAGYLATRTGRLGPAVVAHGLHNAIVGIIVLTS